MNLSERLHTVIAETGIDQVELGRVMGVTKGAVNQLLNGSIQSLKLEYALGAQERFGYNAVWLVLGKGPKKGSASPGADTNSANRGGKEALSDEAEQLISWIRRLDGINKQTPEIFRHIAHILALAHKGALSHNLPATHAVIAEEEALEAIANHRAKELNAENAPRKRAAKAG